ncbi:MAG: hypothetical protein LLG00_07060 [Planctomycetaceae bacterium]|nr:hypothetical protein [Planctomycetaceae bacterium]
MRSTRINGNIGINRISDFIRHSSFVILPMDLSSVIIIAALLVLVAGVMMLSHVRNWRAFQHVQLDAVELDFRRRQFRRRMKTSAMLGVLAIALPIGIGLAHRLRSGWFALFYCLAMLLAVAWIVLLALADIFATRHHYGRLRDQCFVERVKLEAELRRRTKGDGD